MNKRIIFAAAIAAANALSIGNQITCRDTDPGDSLDGGYNCLDLEFDLSKCDGISDIPVYFNPREMCCICGGGMMRNEVEDNTWMEWENQCYAEGNAFVTSMYWDKETQSDIDAGYEWCERQIDNHCYEMQDDINEDCEPLHEFFDDHGMREYDPWGWCSCNPGTNGQSNGDDDEVFIHVDGVTNVETGEFEEGNYLIHGEQDGDGLIHVDGITNVETGEFEDVDQILHVEGYYDSLEEFEAAQGECNNDELLSVLQEPYITIFNEHDQDIQGILIPWFFNEPQDINVGNDEEFVVTLYEHICCHELKEMTETLLEIEGWSVDEMLTYAAEADNYSLAIDDASAKRYRKCYMEELQEEEDPDHGDNFICDVDAAPMMDALDWRLEHIFTNWYYMDQGTDVPVNHDEFIVCFFELLQSDYCSDFKGWVIDILEDNDWNFEQLTEHSVEVHSEKTDMAAGSAWVYCYPDNHDFNDDGVIDADDIRQL